MENLNKKIVGMDYIHEDKVIKQFKTKHITTQTIRRVVTQSLVLECGHKVKVTKFQKIPKNYTYCDACAGNEYKTRVYYSS